jgi:hypothetical protein
MSRRATALLKDAWLPYVAVLFGANVGFALGYVIDVEAGIRRTAQSLGLAPRTDIKTRYIYRIILNLNHIICQCSKSKYIVSQDSRGVERAR